jgi:hypothetical protein
MSNIALVSVLSRRSLPVLAASTALVASSQANFTKLLNDFTTVPNGQVDQLAATNGLFPVTIGGVTITHNIPFQLSTGSFGREPAVTGPDNPGDGLGYFSENATDGSLPNAFIPVNFSSALFAFGATFQHTTTGSLDLTFTGPAVLSAYTGINGTGDLIGTVTDQGGNGVATFLGILSDKANIRSVIITSTGPLNAFAVDAYGFEAGPVPEPATISAFVCGFAGMLARHGVRRRRPANRGR